MIVIELPFFFSYEVKTTLIPLIFPIRSVFHVVSGFCSLPLYLLCTVCALLKGSAGHDLCLQLQAFSLDRGLLASEL